jgi:glycosyltransferase involved in cell wall biosynthesis
MKFIKDIAVIVPTYKRANKLRAFIDNFIANSSRATLYFVITPDDKESQECLEKLGQNYFVFDGEYVASINYGVANTKEPFILCGSDDIEFKDCWDSELLEMAKDESKHIFGGFDCWPVSQTGFHISHPMVRRSYIKGNLYHHEYIHYMNDVELVQRGLKEGCVMITQETLIEHPMNKEEKRDSTYNRSLQNLKHDKDIYNRRKGEFEMVDAQYLHDGLAIPTKLHYAYNNVLVSIIVPSFNDIEVLKRCLLSISANTYYRYELIVINDGSDKLQTQRLPWEKINTKEFFDSLVLEDESCSLRVIHNKKQKWINYNWNLGMKLARGQVVAFINSDVTVSKDWDKFLVALLDRCTIACPYTRSPKEPTPRALNPFFVKYSPNLINGPCFMLRKSNIKELFPIPKNIVHWCGDNVLADRAEKMRGVLFTPLSETFHQVMYSSRKVDKNKFRERVEKDLKAYEKWSGKNMDFIRATFVQNSI